MTTLRCDSWSWSIPILDAIPTGKNSKQSIAWPMKLIRHERSTTALTRAHWRAGRLMVEWTAMIIPGWRGPCLARPACPGAEGRAILRPPIDAVSAFV
jgi:hypothetical protein